MIGVLVSFPTIGVPSAKSSSHWERRTGAWRNVLNPADQQEARKNSLFTRHQHCQVNLAEQWSTNLKNVDSEKPIKNTKKPRPLLTTEPLICQFLSKYLKSIRWPGPFRYPQPLYPTRHFLPSLLAVAAVSLPLRAGALVVVMLLLPPPGAVVFLDPTPSPPSCGSCLTSSWSRSPGCGDVAVATTGSGCIPWPCPPPLGSDAALLRWPEGGNLVDPV